MGEKKIEGKATAWGLRLQVPASILRELDIGVGDDVVWNIEKRGDINVAILRKKARAEEIGGKE